MILQSGVKRIDGGAFGQCGSLDYIVIPNSVEYIAGNAFPGSTIVICNSGSYAETWAVENGYSINSGNSIPEFTLLTVLYLPHNLKTIEAEAFAGIKAEVVIIPEGCSTIGSRAFANASRLIYIYIPSSVTTIAPDAFSGCDNMIVIDRRQ